jgi:CHAP domain
VSARLRSPLPLVAAGAMAGALALCVAALMALFGAGVSCLGGGGSATSGPAARGAAAREIPAARLRLYIGAGRRFDISWPFLASIGVQECGADGLCHEVSASGCAGPMQIAYVRGSACSPDPSAPTIWERFRIDGDGDGRTDVFDPADAIYTAAHILRADLAAPPAGGSYAGYREAACRYYGACADSAASYASEVMTRALRYGFGRETKLQLHAGGAKDGPPAPAGSICEGQGIGPGGASAGAIVRIARHQLGTTESPPGSNCTRYGPCEEWCSLFVAWVWRRAGIEMAGGTAPYAYSGSIYEWAKAHGGRILPPSATPAPGDAVLFGWGPTASEHVAIVERVLGGQITTIDGNYADRVARVGPYPPSLAVIDGEPAPVYAYAEPPGPGSLQRGGRRG